MKVDFTHRVYQNLISVLLEKNYLFVTMEKYFTSNFENTKIVLIRHDVDRLPGNALRLAQLESQFNQKSTFYFRMIPSCYNENIIKQIVDLGHELAYHYEDLSLKKGDFYQAIQSFESNLNKLRKFYPVSTICMHGSPISRWDNRDLWTRYNLNDFGLVGEPYLSLDFNEIFYLTDTGRKWNDESISIRDKVISSQIKYFNSTFDVIQALNQEKLPNKLMFNIHPHRWHSNIILWFYELVFQNAKNLVKKRYYSSKLINDY
ncbi:MAG: hypothetical protein ACFFC1_07620 [Promethearchaeota archaeon]